MSLRILHLLDPAAGEGPLLACRESLRTPGFEHTVWLVGPRSAAEFAAAAGIAADAVLSTPAHRRALAWPAARALAAHIKRAGDAPDVVHCWSFSTLTLARLAFGPRLPKVVFAASAPAETPRWQRAQLSDGPLLVTTRRGLWRQWVADVSLDARLLPLPLPPVPPTTAQDRDTLRASLGVDTAEGTLLIALLADPPRTADARAFSFMLGLLHLAGVRVIGVAARGIGQGRRGARFVRAHGRRWGFVEWDGPMSALAAAADLAMWGPSEDAGLLAGVYARAGVPIVVPAGDAATTLSQRSPDVIVSLGPSVPQTAAALLPMSQRLAASPRTPTPLPAQASSQAEFSSLLSDLWADSARRWLPEAAGAHPTGAIAR